MLMRTFLRNCAILIALFVGFQVYRIASQPRAPHFIDLLWDNTTRFDEKHSMIAQLSDESRMTLVALCRLDVDSERRKTLLQQAMEYRYGFIAVHTSELMLADKCALTKNLGFGDAGGANALTVERVRALITSFMNLCYGENSVEALRTILRIATNGLQLSGDFVDIGCGRGKMLTVACAFEPERFGRCRGVDIVDERIQQAHMLIQQAKLKSPPDWLARLNGVDATLADVTDDRVASDLLRNASLVYMYSTCFDARLHEAIVRALLRYLRRGARVVMHQVSDASLQAVLNNTDPSLDKFRLFHSAPRNEITFTTVYFAEKIV